MCIRDRSIVSFVRQGEDIDDDLVILINFDPASYESFRVGVPREGCLLYTSFSWDVSL